MSEVVPAMVERKARIFRFGHYPKKRWGITAEEFRAANGETGTIPIGLDPIRKGHYVGESSIFDGATGTAEFSVDGDEVLATLRMPEWVERAVREHDLKVSGIFHPTDKTLQKIDLVERPHIADAVLFAHDNGDVLVCEDDEPEVPVEFCDDRDVRFFAQEMHDLAAHHHASLCDPSIQFAEPTEADHHCRLMHDYAVHAGKAYCPGLEPEDDEEEVQMSDENDVQADEVANNNTPVAFEDTQSFRDMQSQIARLQAQVIEKDAVAFADSVTRGKEARAYPVERQSIVDGYRRAALIDAKLPEAITFSDGTNTVQGSHLDAFKAGILVRPKVTVRDEKAVGFTDLPEEPSTGAVDEAKAREERRQKNLAWKAQFGASVG